MPDLDELDNEPTQEHNSFTESMEKPGGKHNKTAQIIFVLVVALVIILVFATKKSDKSESVNSIEEESIETIDDSRSKRADLKLPKQENKQSLKEQLEDTTPVVQVISAPTTKDTSSEDNRKRKMSELFLMDQQKRSEREKAEQARQDILQQRMMSGMKGGNTQSKSTSSALAGTAQKRQDLINKRNEVQNLQNKILSGDTSSIPGLSSKRSGLSSRRTKETYDTQLLSLPSSQSNTVYATNLEDVDFLITEGTIIQASLESAINSSLPGKIRAIVNTPVYSYTGDAKLIDSTSELIGEYRSASDGGSPRVFVIWTRLITSDGISIRLDSGGIDPIGRSGVSGWVDTHFMKRFGSSIMLSIIGGVTQAEMSNDNQSQAVANSFNKSAEIALDSSINIAATVKLNQGKRIAIFVNQDLNFKHAMSTKRIDRLNPSPEQNHQISYDRVFDDSPLTIEERAMLANRFIADKKNINAESHMQKPYTAEAGQSLHAVIKEWARRGNHTLYWQVKDEDGNSLDWKLATDISIHGTLHYVIARILNAYKKAGVDLSHQFFKENNVLVIRSAEQ
jgi:type IV secretion system protein VirB10